MVTTEVQTIEVKAAILPKEVNNERHKTKKERVEAYGDVLSDGTIIECIYRVDKTPTCAFVIARPGQEPVVAESFSKGASIVFPPERSIRQFEKRTIVLPSGFVKYGSDRMLLDELRSYIARYVDLSSFEISLLAHYAMATWTWDAWNAFPYLRFKGEPSTGKTRCLEVMKEICYRSVDLGVSPSRSALFRWTDKVRGTLLIDEADYEGDLRSDLIKLLNAGYRKDGVVALSIPSEDDWEGATFSVGSAKIMANRQSFNDSALESRCITICTVSKDLSPHIPTELPHEFRKEGEELRNKLLRWRMDKFHSIDKGEGALVGIDGRAKQLGLPIYNISPDPVFQNAFLKFLQQRRRNMREYEPLQVVIAAIARISDMGNRNRLLLKDVRYEALIIANERDISEYQFSFKRIAELVRGLQFRTSKWGLGTVVYLDPTILKTQRERFGIGSDEGDDSDDSGERGEQAKGCLKAW